jgi:crotonobetainyl-CoA:carnitine CoA-transferase CaiB-like acyl-CoA transferase
VGGVGVGHCRAWSNRFAHHLQLRHVGVGVSAVDHHGAALFAAGILAALVRRERTDEGGRVDVNLFNAALDLQMESLVCFLNGDGRDDIRQVGDLSGWYYGAPYGVYATKDNFIAISLGSLEVLSDALQIPRKEQVPDAQAYERREEAAEGISRALRSRSTGEWCAVFTARGIWHSPVNDYSRLAEDPQVIHNENFVTVSGATGTRVTLVTHPIRYDGRTPGVRLPPQMLGAQTADILAELGYDHRAISALFEDGVVAGEPRAEAARENIQA